MLPKLIWPIIVWVNCCSDLKIFANSWPSVSNFKSSSQSLEHFILKVGQNHFGNKIPLQMQLCFDILVLSSNVYLIAFTEILWTTYHCSTNILFRLKPYETFNNVWYFSPRIMFGYQRSRKDAKFVDQHDVTIHR